MSEKSLNTNIKVFEINYPPPTKTSKQTNKQPTPFMQKNPSASVSPQKIILGEVLAGKGSNPREKAQCYYMLLQLQMSASLCTHLGPSVLYRVFMFCSVMVYPCTPIFPTIVLLRVMSSHFNVNLPKTC